ncbi:MAG: cohesin domain-containing protein [Chloroflexi bacterium]|nr:cohesin domain-containing protein [Chloroflexota bacterium]MBU1660104.1 cohesin domain-containing protein [Chloroflexota bacterium]
MNPKETTLRKPRWPVIILILCCAALLLGGLISNVRPSRAGTVKFGCPQQLTVRTGQDFYITVVISDVVDLYAWQSDFTYNTTYLEYKHIVFGDFLTQDGAAQYRQPPVASTGLVDNIAATRLSANTGLDGDGHVFYVVFKALKETSTYTGPKVASVLLVNRQPLEIAKDLINSGYCRVYIDDDVPPLIQPPIGEKVYLPLVLR